MTQHNDIQQSGALIEYSYHEIIKLFIKIKLDK